MGKQRQEKYSVIATRPLNKRERRERLLDNYEDSLYASSHRQSKPRKKTPDASPEAASRSTEQQRFARRAEARRRRPDRPVSSLPAIVDHTTQ